jgi:alpha-L-fucosidase
MTIYHPTVESLAGHELPTWFDAAKLGIFVHYGLFSVPGWAVVAGKDAMQIIRKKGWNEYFCTNPYSEWYLNSLRIPGSPTQTHHRRTFGNKFSYDDFVPVFNNASSRLDTEAWAELFVKAGARYVVLTCKHADGFLLWPSAYPNLLKRDYAAKRDIVGELANALRDHNLDIGLYYCSGLDWAFNSHPITRASDLILGMPNNPEYVSYCTKQWHELINRYNPSVLWGDIGYPFGGRVLALFSHFYNQVPNGVVNDRFYQLDLKRLEKILWVPGVRSLVERIITRACIGEFQMASSQVHSDFCTYEYSTPQKLNTKKWELCRGMGYSFGYNQNENAADMLSVEALVKLFVDVVSKNGNLLLGVGPMADGTIPTLQKERLEGLGKWLEKNGEGFFGTHSWYIAEAVTCEGIHLRFTQKAKALYITILDTPLNHTVTLRSLQCQQNTKIQPLDFRVRITWKQTNEGVFISLLSLPTSSPATVLKVTPQPVIIDNAFGRQKSF